ncbi:unnamed protein product [Closterium sp. NIES-64]|nr:unnamed protein product [Closterium sp. NIES-64]
MDGSLSDDEVTQQRLHSRPQLATTAEDLTANLPDDCLVHVFRKLGTSDLARCSLVCRRWFMLDAETRPSMSLRATLDAAPDLASLFRRFTGVQKLVLKCERNVLSIDDASLDTIARQCVYLRKLKLKNCRQITDDGMERFAQACPELRKFSCGSCGFGLRGLNALLNGCIHLEDLTVKRSLHPSLPKDRVTQIPHVSDSLSPPANLSLNLHPSLPKDRVTQIPHVSDSLSPPANLSLKRLCLKDQRQSHIWVPLLQRLCLKDQRQSHIWVPLLQVSVNFPPPPPSSPTFSSRLPTLHLDPFQLSSGQPLSEAPLPQGPTPRLCLKDQRQSHIWVPLLQVSVNFPPPPPSSPTFSSRLPTLHLDPFQLSSGQPLSEAPLPQGPTPVTHLGAAAAGTLVLARNTGHWDQVLLLGISLLSDSPFLPSVTLFLLLQATSRLETLILARNAGHWDQVLGSSLREKLTPELSQITDKGLQCIGKCPKLEALVVVRTPECTDASMAAIYVERVQITDKGLQCIGKCPKLEALVVVRTPECTDAGMAAVAAGCSGLKRLHVEGWAPGHLGDPGLSAIARHCRQLQELLLVSHACTVSSLQLLASNCPSLERLTLCSGHNMGDPELATLAYSCSNLRRLCVKACNKVTDLGIYALANGCPSLQRLKVRRCPAVSAHSLSVLQEQRPTLVITQERSRGGVGRGGERGEGREGGGGRREGGGRGEGGAVVVGGGAGGAGGDGDGADGGVGGGAGGGGLGGLLGSGGSGGEAGRESGAGRGYRARPLTPPLHLPLRSSPSPVPARPAEAPPRLTGSASGTGGSGGSGEGGSSSSSGGGGGGGETGGVGRERVIEGGCAAGLAASSEAGLGAGLGVGGVGRGSGTEQGAGGERRTESVVGAEGLRETEAGGAARGLPEAAGAAGQLVALGIREREWATVMAGGAAGDGAGGGAQMAEEEFDELCFEFGIELDDVTTEKAIIRKEKHLTDEVPAEDEEVIYKIEVPANRYDLLCLEGLARSLRIFLEMDPVPQFKLAAAASPIRMTVTPETALIRPFVVGAVLRNITFDQHRYNSFIDLQDRLHQNLCRRRTLVAIGTHDLDTLTPPFTYEALPPTEIKFVPLKQTKEFNAAELMEFYKSHNKLKKFLHIISESPVFPVIYDANRTVLSLPPVINGSHSAIKLTTRNVFIECTATDLTKAKIVLNTVVTMFSEFCDNKFEVEPVEVVSTEGQVAVYPQMEERDVETSVGYINKAIGVDLKAEEIARLLTRMQLPSKVVEGRRGEDGAEVVSVTVPPTRSDVLHPCDIMEDVAIAHGYNNIARTEPKTVCEGKQQPLNQLCDLLRGEVAQAGFTEVLTWALIARSENFEMVNLKDDGKTAVVIGNPRSADFEVVRSSLLPGMLKTLASNKDSPRPVKLFEVSDVCLLDESKDVGARNERRLIALYCNLHSGFEVIHGLVDRLMESLGVACGGQAGADGTKALADGPATQGDGGDAAKAAAALKYFIAPSQSPQFFGGRQADILCKGKSIGTFGVVHPESLRLPFSRPAITFSSPFSTCSLPLSQLAVPFSSFLAR